MNHCIKHPELAGKLIDTTEQTTAGVAKVEQMDLSGRLRHPTIAANSSKSKHMYDNRYGVGQTFIEAFMKVTESMICGKTVVVCGFGFCGKGIAERAKGIGAMGVHFDKQTDEQKEYARQFVVHT